MITLTAKEAQKREGIEPFGGIFNNDNHRSNADNE
jgi:hypothetical protein